MLSGKRTCLLGLVHLVFSSPLLHQELARGEINQVEAISYL